MAARSTGRFRATPVTNFRTNDDVRQDIPKSFEASVLCQS